MKDYLYSLRNSGAKLGLERVRRLADALGSPQKDYRVVLVAGTSGKGSTAAMIASVLRESGLKVGSFISPHLSNLTERIRIDGREISEERMGGLISKIEETIDEMKNDDGFEHPTFFEVVAAGAMLCFKEEKVDIAVLEVGLGGRLDATNITEPEVSVITNISLEHTRILGDTVTKIAGEKAGIIRSGKTLITAAGGEALGVFERICQEKNCRIVRVGNEITVERESAGMDGQEFIARAGGKEYKLYTPLLGLHQLENAACAVGAAIALGMPEDAITRGIEKVEWPGRLEIVQGNPMVVLDCAKDADAARRLREAIQNDFKFDSMILVFGVSNDKNIENMIAELAPLARVVVATEHKVMDRAMDADSVLQIAAKYCEKCTVAYDVKEAVRAALALAGPGDLVLVTGSIFTVGEAREMWHGNKGNLGRGLNEVPGR
jgi:dihydrofolate synthase/folylpolyglutamate synthase